MTTVTWQYLRPRRITDLLQNQAIALDGKKVRRNATLQAMSAGECLEFGNRRRGDLYQVTSVTFTAIYPRFTIHLVVWQFWGRAAVAS